MTYIARALTADMNEKSWIRARDREDTPQHSKVNGPPMNGGHLYPAAARKKAVQRSAMKMNP